MSIEKKMKWKVKLTQTSAEFETLLLSLSEEQLHTPVISEGNTWTPLDIVAHLLENERALSIHVHKIRQKKAPLPEDFDLETWNAGLTERAKPLPLSVLLEKMAETRSRTLEELDTLEEREFYIIGHHPLRGLISIEQYFETIVFHIIWHSDDIKKGLGLTEEKSE